MCHKIESSFVLIHCLKKNEFCTIKEIVDIKRKVEKKIPSVYVDVSKNSILETISFYPEIFSWEDNLIKRREKAEEYFQNDVIEYFSNFDIDKVLEKKIIQCIEKN